VALSHAILVSLLDRPQSGYDLAKRFDQTVGYFWKASHQQIYLELHKLAQTGCIRGEKVEQESRPNRIVYEITPLGRDALDSWVEERTEPPSVKEELLVKLFALGSVSTDTVLAEVERRLAFHQARLVEYEAVMAEHYPEPERLSARRRGLYLGLRMGILFERSTIEWCREATATIGELKRPRQVSPSRKSRGV
jgi:PadR family transcriptional regulator, regulatory protein AphA